MKTVAFIDFKHPTHGLANRDQTGTFGSGMHSSGGMGKLITSIKKNNLILPNLSLAYLRAIAEQNGLETASYDNLPQGEDLVIIATSMHHYKYEVELAHKIKAKFPNSKIGFVNSFSSVKPELFVDAGDFVLRGEPENAFDKILKGELEPKGVIEEQGKVDVMKIPYPSWKGLDINRFGYGPTLLKKPFLTMMASRGCPFNCPFCPYIVQQGAPLRARTNEDVINELKHLKSTYGVRSILFRDLTFTIKMKATKELMKLIIEADLDIEFGCETRLDRLDDELIELMQQANFKSINVGIESPNEDILSKAGRRTIENNEMIKKVRKLEECGILVQAFYILGLEDDTRESMEKTIRFSYMLNTFSAQFCVYTPFPGTKSWEDINKDQLLTLDFSEYTEYDPVFKNEHVSANEIIQYRDKAFNGYYIRPQWLYKHGVGLAGRILKTSYSNHGARL